MRSQRAAAFSGKAERLLQWAGQARQLMIDHGSRAEMDGVERTFFWMLATIASAHEALGASAAIAGHKAWREEIDELRRTDELLRYFLFARNSDVHDAIVKWDNRSWYAFTYETVDAARRDKVVHGYRVRDEYESEAAKDLRLFTHVFDLPAGRLEIHDIASPPTTARLEQAGIKIRGLTRTLLLGPFHVRSVGQIGSPTTHLGKAINPSAVEGSDLVIDFYQAKLRQLSLLENS